MPKKYSRRECADILNESIDSLFKYVRNKIMQLYICDVDAEWYTGKGGSGLWIQIGSHYFIATAAHVLDRNNNIYVSPPAPFIEKEPYKIAPSRLRKDDNLDVAYLEVDKSCISELQIVPLRLENLSIQTRRSREPALVAGFPTQLCKKSEVEIGTNLEFHAVSITGVPIYLTDNPPELGNVEYPRNATPDNDLVIRWSPKDHTWSGYDWVDKTRLDVPDIGLTKLQGISGAGIWFLNLELGKEVIWRPDKQPKLVGIQHSYNKKKQYIRGTKIHHWLSLISADYHDLQDEMAPYIGTGEQ